MFVHAAPRRKLASIAANALMYRPHRVAIHELAQKGLRMNSWYNIEDHVEALRGHEDRKTCVDCDTQRKPIMFMVEKGPIYAHTALWKLVFRCRPCTTVALNKWVQLCLPGVCMHYLHLQMLMCMLCHMHAMYAALDRMYVHAMYAALERRLVDGVAMRRLHHVCV